MHSRGTQAVWPRAQVQPAELVVFLQNRFWRNSCVNLKIDRRPPMPGQQAVRLQYALLEWLKAKHAAQ